MKYKFLILWLAGVLSTILALPYVLELQRAVLEQSPLTMPQIIAISIVQVTILLAVAVFLGLRLARAIGLVVFPLLESGLAKKEILKRLAKLSIPLGILVALAIRGADLFFAPFIPQLAAAMESMPFWKALSVAPYGGIVEELLLRLFVVSLFAWLIGKVTRTKAAVKNNAIMWTAIIVSTILFGLGHLPATATVMPLSTIVVVRALMLNGIAGIIFGWLYWKKGLEYAIVAHFTADVVLHAILPALS